METIDSSLRIRGRIPKTVWPVLAALATIALIALAGCDGSPSSLSFDGNAVVQNGTLEIRGTDGPDHISIEVAPTGVRLEMMGAAEVFQESITSISVAGGAGDDYVRVHQSAPQDLDLAILGGEGDDEIVMTLRPEGDGSAVTVAVYTDTGPGSDRTHVSWQSRDQPFDAVLNLTVDGVTSSGDEVDQIDMGLGHGVTDDPSWLTLNWWASGPPETGDDVRSLTLDATLPAEGEMDLDLAAKGGIGWDEIVVNADYSGVFQQQGRLTLDADLGEGDNRLERGVISGSADVVLETRVLAGTGADSLIIVDELGGDGSLVYELDVGDGDNETRLHFGDGVRGARPSSGSRSVDASYRSGAGKSAVDIAGRFVEPATSSVNLDFGGGQGAMTGRYRLPTVPASEPPPGGQTAPSQVSVVILSANGSDLDLTVDVPDPSPEDGGDEPGSVALLGTGIHDAHFDLVRRLEPLSADGSPVPEEEWTLRLSALDLAGPATLTGASGGSVRRLVYLQDSIRVDGGGTLDVALNGHDGDDAILAHVLGIAGDGAFGLVADGGSGADVVAALSDDLDPAGTGALSFEARGGAGDDVLGMQTLTALQRPGPVTHDIDAGAATDACFSSSDVGTAACETQEGITSQFIQVLADLFGAELAGMWESGTTP